MARGLARTFEDIWGGVEEAGKGVGHAAKTAARDVQAEGARAARAAAKADKGGFARYAGDIGHGAKEFWSGDPNVAPTAQLGPKSLAYQQQMGGGQPGSPMAGIAKPGSAAEGALLKTVPKELTFDQVVQQALAPYMQELNNLGPEYQAEMNYLKPYLTGDMGVGQEQQIAKSIGGVGVKPNDPHSPFNQAMSGAEQTLATAYENQPPPGFGQVAAMAKGSEKAIPYQDVLQAGLGYEKYLQTYGGMRPNVSGWPQYLQNVYKDITGTSTSTGGLPTQQQAAAGQNANQLFSATTQQPTSSTANPGQ